MVGRRCCHRSLVDEQGQGGADEACAAEGDTEAEVELLAGEQGDGGEDDGDLEEGLAEIEAGGAVFGDLDLGEVFFAFLDVLEVVGAFGGGGGGVAAGLEGEQVGGGAEGLVADGLGLILGPHIAGAGLHEDGFGVAAMAEHRDHGDEHGEDGDAEGDVDSMREVYAGSADCQRF